MRNRFARRGKKCAFVSSSVRMIAEYDDCSPDARKMSQEWVKVQ